MRGVKLPNSTFGGRVVLGGPLVLQCRTPTRRPWHDPSMMRGKREKKRGERGLFGTSVLICIKQMSAWSGTGSGTIGPSSKPFGGQAVLKLPLLDLCQNVVREVADGALLLFREGGKGLEGD